MPARCVLSYPTSESCRGTATLSSSAAERAPIAEMSLTANTAVGGSASGEKPYPGAVAGFFGHIGALDQRLQARLIHDSDVGFEAQPGHFTRCSTYVGNAPMPEVEQVLHREPGARGIVVGDHIHIGQGDVAAGGDHGRYGGGGFFRVRVTVAACRR